MAKLGPYSRASAHTYNVIVSSRVLREWGRSTHQLQMQDTTSVMRHRLASYSRSWIGRRSSTKMQDQSRPGWHIERPSIRQWRPRLGHWHWMQKVHSTPLEQSSVSARMKTKAGGAAYEFLLWVSGAAQTIRGNRHTLEYTPGCCRNRWCGQPCFQTTWRFVSYAWLN